MSRHDLSCIDALIESRVSANHYDPSRAIADAQIESLIRLATRAPSAYNLQNWSFVAVRSAQAKAKLKAAAYGQQKVADAAATLIVCGVTSGHERLSEVLKPAMQAGIVPPPVYESWVAAAMRCHRADAVLRRDEAVRSASLAAMTLMLAAEARGLATSAVGGFDAQAVARDFGLAEDELPVMLITIGYAGPGNWPQKPRRPVGEVMRFA